MALEALPESECCPHELYRLLCNNQDASKRFAIIEDEREEPIAIVCLRRRNALDNCDWVPLTHYIIPGMVFPVREGCVGRVLSVLNRDIWVAWWRMGGLCEHIDGIRSLEVKPTYAIDLTGDYEKYWRKSSHLTEVKKQRHRCKDFEISINGDGMSEWVVRHWELKWRETPSFQRPDLEDKLAALEYLQRLGKAFTLTVLDKKQPIAGFTVMVHGDCLVGLYIYREPQYHQFGLGTYVIDSAAKWAAESGFTGIDLGGDHAGHKRRWGPIKGAKTSIHICPEYIYLMGKGRELLSNVRKKGIRKSCVIAATKVIDAMRKVL